MENTHHSEFYFVYTKLKAIKKTILLHLFFAFFFVNEKKNVERMKRHERLGKEERKALFYWREHLVNHDSQLSKNEIEKKQKKKRKENVNWI